MLFGRKHKDPIKVVDKNVQEWKYTTCGYCSTGCSMEIGLNPEGKPVATRGVIGAEVNSRKLCIKGMFEHELFDSSGRGAGPLHREKHFEEYKEVSCDYSLDKLADQIKRIQSSYGRDSFA